MKQFELNQNVLDGPGARRIIKMYNKLARTLIAFEYLWHQAWVQSIDQAKSGLQATLIIRHPEDQKLYVNFDLELLQLIREAKCLDRMGVEVPESAKILLFQCSASCAACARLLVCSLRSALYVHTYRGPTRPSSVRASVKGRTNFCLICMWYYMYESWFCARGCGCRSVVWAGIFDR